MNKQILAGYVFAKYAEEQGMLGNVLPIVATIPVASLASYLAKDKLGGAAYGGLIAYLAAKMYDPATRAGEATGAFLSNKTGLNKEYSESVGRILFPLAGAYGAKKLVDRAVGKERLAAMFGKDKEEKTEEEIDPRMYQYYYGGQ